MRKKIVMVVTTTVAAAATQVQALAASLVSSQKWA